MSCPLCNELDGTPVGYTSYEQIWSALANAYDVVFEPDVIARHTPAQEVALLECRHCGLYYFSPAIPGGADFYHQLTSANCFYYNNEKWDFQTAIELVKPGDAILDIACGDGAWLQYARSRGAEVCGIDTNSAAVTAARQAGLQVQCLTLEEFAQANPGRFDIVTAFQIIEHIPRVLPFVAAARDCLKPGGKLILTVPNRLRCFKAPFEPLDHPPHHMSRWTANQFIALASLTGLTLKATHYEPARMSDCRALVRCWVAPPGQTETLWARAIGRVAFGPWLYVLYSRTGLLNRWRFWRMSMMAVLQK